VLGFPCELQVSAHQPQVPIHESQLSIDKPKVAIYYDMPFGVIEVQGKT